MTCRNAVLGDPVEALTAAHRTNGVGSSFLPLLDAVGERAVPRSVTSLNTRGFHLLRGETIMSVGVILDFPNATKQQYDQVIGMMGLTPRGAGPRGLLFHWMTAGDDGFRVTDVWRARERFDEFARDEIGPYSEQAGISDPAPPEFHQVHNYFTPGATGDLSAPVAVVMEFHAELTQYDEVIGLMGLTSQGPAPDGCLFHWACSLNGDRVRITDVWQDRPTFERFAEEMIGPYSAKVGVSDPVSTEFYSVYNFFTAGA